MGWPGWYPGFIVWILDLPLYGTIYPFVPDGLMRFPEFRVALAMNTILCMTIAFLKDTHASNLYPNIILTGLKIAVMSVDYLPQTVLVKPVSADCNLACAYCFYSPKSSLYPEPNPRMNDETLAKLIEEALMSGAPQVSFVWQGGEPTLAGLDFFKEAVQLQDLYRYPIQKIQNSIQTNGIIIDEEWVDFFMRARTLSKENTRLP